MVGKREGDVDGRVHAVRVFHFGLGQRRTTVKAPVHGLQAAEHVTLVQDASQRADLVGLVAVVHRHVRTIPLAQHTQALEVLALAVDLLERVGAGLGLHFRHRQVLAVLLFDLDFDGHAVAVPARHVVRVIAGHVAALDDDVLQDLVDRVADVDVAVRIGRAVMQHEARPAAAGRTDRLVDVVFLPLRNPGGLALGEVAPHGEGGVGQVEGLFIVHERQNRRARFARLRRWRQSGKGGQEIFLRPATFAGIRRVRVYRMH